MSAQRSSLYIDATQTTHTVEPSRPLILILPARQHTTTARTVRTFGVLADGNNRAEDDYTAGAERVLESARELLAPGGRLDTFVAFILSPENLHRRSDDFLRRLCKAFIGAGVRLAEGGPERWRGIEWDYLGDPDALRRRGPPGEHLLEAMRAAARIANENARAWNSANPGWPQRRLLLGVNYPRDATRSLNLLYRSGVEEPGVQRFGSLEPHEDLILMADDWLWPEVTVAHLTALLDRAERTAARAAPGPTHTPAQLCALIPALLDTLQTHDLTIALPCDAETLRSEHGGSIEGSESRLQLKLVGAPAALRCDGIVIVDGAEGELRLPGPPTLPIGYANLIRSTADPYDIAAATLKLTRFIARHPSLRGSDRDKESAITDDIRRWWSALSERAAPATPAPVPAADHTALQAYGQLADDFVAAMAPWIESTGVPIALPEQRRSMANYALTCFFMSCCPWHPDWAMIAPRWLRTGEVITRGMALVYHADEAVFDWRDDSESLIDAVERRVFAAQVLAAAVDPDAPMPEVPEGPGSDALTHLAALHRGLADALKGEAPPALAQAWAASMDRLYTAMATEADPRRTERADVSAVVAGDAEAAARLEREVWSRCPEPVASWARDASERLTSGTSDSPGRDHATIELICHLREHAASIGSGAALRSAGLTLSPDDVDAETAALMERACELSDFHRRIRNDIAGVFTNHEALEGKRDAVAIALRGFDDDGTLATRMRASAWLLTLADEIRAEGRRLWPRIADRWPSVGLALYRASIADLIYKRSHYRLLDREGMSRLFEECANYGILRSTQ